MLNILLTWLLKVRSFSDRSRSTKGFTLMELIIAASLTLFVVGIAGWALVTITKANKIAKATSEMQYDYNRAVEFIAEEIKGSKQVFMDPLTDANLTAISNGYFTKKSWMTPVFAFLPDEDIPGSAYVIYYIVDTTKPDARGKELAGDHVLYRWGPAYDANGKYSTYDHDGIPTTPEKIQHPDNWQGNALVDLVLGTWENVDATKRLCRRPTDVAPQQWKRYPANDGDQKGFFICVPTAGNLKGKQVEVHALGQIIPDKGKNAYLTNKKGLVYEVVTEAFLRTAVSANYISTNGGFPLVVPSPVPGGDTPPITPTDPTEPLYIKVTNLHGDCAAHFVTEDQDDLGSDMIIPAGGNGTTTRINTSFEILGYGGACSGVNSLLNNSHYKPVTSGSLITDIVSTQEGITRLTKIIKDKVGASAVDANGKITLPQPNQFLMFFEQEPDPQNKSGETTAKENDLLFDDMIILVQVNSSSP